MNVDWLDDETIFYLDEDGLKELVNSGDVWKHKEEQMVGVGEKTKKERTFSIQLHTSLNTTGGRYDDCLLALEEAVAFIKTAEALGATNGIDDGFDLRKVVRTFDHYQKIQQEYE